MVAPAAVENHGRDCSLSRTTVAHSPHYGKLRVFLTHVRESSTTTLFQDVEDEYKKRGINLGALAMHKSKEKELLTTMDCLLEQCNALSLSKVPVVDYCALKLVCYFSLHSDPGHIKLQNYDESRDLYVKGNKIHLQIVVKDKREQYKDVHMVYVLTPKERAAIEHFMEDHPDCEYLFTSQSKSTIQQCNGNFNTAITPTNITPTMQSPIQEPMQSPMQSPMQTPEVIQANHDDSTMQSPMQTPEVIQADHANSTILARLSELKALEDKSEYHALATQYLQQHVAAFLEQCKTGDYHTFWNDKAFFLIHFPHLHVTNMDQVQQYYQDKKLSISTVRGHYGKIRVYLTHIRETKSTMLFEDVELEYSKRGRNLSALHVHKSKEIKLPTTIDELLDKCNQMTVCKKNVMEYFALKLMCYYSLRGDPGHIKLRNYDESHDLYVKDGNIHLRIVVKDNREKYKDVHMVYSMTPEEKKVLDWFTKTNPQHVYLFMSQMDSSKHQRTNNFNMRPLKQSLKQSLKQPPELCLGP
ncbi:hypothetical protein GGF32_008302 [Allomyces javanicus]|nr:hypothetical protein GGF32_008302 [Allomyces javanicus]